MSQELSVVTQVTTAIVSIIGALVAGYIAIIQAKEKLKNDERHLEATKSRLEINEKITDLQSTKESK